VLGSEARLLVLMLILRTAHTGSGNVVGQDVTGLGLTGPEGAWSSGWLAAVGSSWPGNAGDLLASRPRVPQRSQSPRWSSPRAGRAFTFGRKMRPKLSGWGQRVVADRRFRKTKAAVGTRLLALALATHSG
jgi:hypothetical protein